MLSIAGITSVVTSIVSWPFKQAGNSFLSVLAGAIESACLSIVKTMATFWVNVPTPNLTTSTGGLTPAAPVAYLDSHLEWYMAAFCLLAIVVGVIKMVVWERGSAAIDLLKGMIVFIVVCAASLTVISLLVDASDQFSKWILSSSLNVGDARLGDAVSKGFSSMLVLDSPGVPVFLSILLGLFAALGGIVQVFLMYMRAAMLVVLAGVLPVTFSLWTTNLGKQWSQKACAWLLAFILYKPAAAIVYATAFQLIGTGDQTGNTADVFAGLALLMMAIAAMPALIRFCVPAAGVIAAGGSGMALGLAGGAAGAMMLPRGAVALKPMGGGSVGAAALNPRGADIASGFTSAAGGSAGSAGGAAAAGAGAVAAPLTVVGSAVESAAAGVERATRQSSGDGDAR